MRAHRGFYEGDLGYVYDRLENATLLGIRP
jgi:hypothetical protein